VPRFSAPHSFQPCFPPSNFQDYLPSLSTQLRELAEF
jgi:hypothetical protein